MLSSVDSTLKVLDEPAPLGLSLLVAPDHPSIDIVFVHGFNGHPERTWRHKGDAGNQPDAPEDPGDERPRKFQKLFDSIKIPRDRKPVYWPKDLLPHTVPNARILAYGYDTHLGHRLSSPRSQKSVYDFAKDFLTELEAARRSQPTRPLLLIAHSLGGVVVKEMLRQSYGYLNHQPHLRTISESTLGIIFFGTPHGGADPQGLVRTIAENIARAFGFTANETVLESLLPSSERLRQLRDEFGPMARAEGWKIHCFQEDHGIKALGGRKVVDDASSCLSDSSLEITQHIANNHMDMCRFSGMNDAEYRKVAAAIHRILGNSNDRPPHVSRSTLSAEERQAYIKSLRFDQIDSRHATIKTAHAKTCRWFLKKSGYQDWLALERLSEHNGFLWIKGKAGTGKSTLMKYIYANAKKTMLEATVISFFYNARGEDLEKSTEGMYRSLLLQLLEDRPELERILDVLPRPLLSETGEFEGQWQLETLKNTFQAAVRSLGSRTLVLFVDALDECREDDVRDMVAFFETLSQEAVQSKIQLHTCFSSRHYPYISVDKCVELVLENQEGHQDDLAHYLQTELKIGKSQRSEKIKNEVLQRANGIFLWVVLVVRILQKEFDRGRVHALQKRLNEIPDGLDKLFEDILTRDARNSDDLLLCLQWILFAKRPLKREELYFAMLAGNEPDQLTAWDPSETTTDVMDRFILDCSKGLAELTKTKNQTVQFIHESVRDYLLKGKGLVHLQRPLESDFEGLSHEKLKLCCQNYLKLERASRLHMQRQDTAESGMERDATSDSETQLDSLSIDNNHELQDATSSSSEARGVRENLCAQYPFLSYAVSHLFDHAEAAAEVISQTAFITELDLATWREYNNILERYSIRKYSPSVSLLYVLAEKNVPRLIRIELQKMPHMDIKGERHQFPLRAAVAAKNKEAVEEFLRPVAGSKDAAGRDVDFISSQIHDRRHACADFLLQRATTISKLKEETVLFWAFATGNIDLVETLLATEKVQLTWQAKIRNGCRLAVGLSASDLRLALATVLLYTNQHETVAKGTNAYAISLLRVHVLPWAFEHGYGLLIRHLLWYMVCVAGGIPGAESRAVKPLQSDADFIALMSQQHISVDSELGDATYRTLLSFAAGYGLAGVVKYILEHTSHRLDERDSSGRTPLAHAILNCCSDVVETLIPATNINFVEPDGQSLRLPLSSTKHKEMIELLLKYRASFQDIEIDHRDPLSWACENGHESMVELLLEHGHHKVNSRDSVDMSPLHFAALNGHESIAKLLLADPAVEVNARDSHDDTPLHMSAQGGHDSVLKLLLQHGDVDVNTRNIKGQNPLLAAARNGHESTTKLLLEREDIDVNAGNVYGASPLHAALRWSPIAIVRLLLEHQDIDPDLTCFDPVFQRYRPALEMARGRGHREVVELLETKMRQRQSLDRSL
ncbi:hypothetical protein AYO22_06287 [Fonsecaea multimorphosa]|nr:hypothetical protein AYO22_06287 [Fonsecaea multimorphosa]